MFCIKKSRKSSMYWWIISPGQKEADYYIKPYKRWGGGKDNFDVKFQVTNWVIEKWSCIPCFKIKPFKTLNFNVLIGKKASWISDILPGPPWGWWWLTHHCLQHPGGTKDASSSEAQDRTRCVCLKRLSMIVLDQQVYYQGVFGL